MSKIGWKINNNDAILGDCFLVSLMGKATLDADKRFFDDSILTLNDFYGLAPGQSHCETKMKVSNCHSTKASFDYWFLIWKW